MVKLITNLALYRRVLKAVGVVYRLAVGAGTLVFNTCAIERKFNTMEVGITRYALRAAITVAIFR